MHRLFVTRLGFLSRRPQTARQRQRECRENIVNDDKRMFLFFFSTFPCRDWGHMEHGGPRVPSALENANKNVNVPFVSMQTGQPFDWPNEQKERPKKKNTKRRGIENKCSRFSKRAFKKDGRSRSFFQQQPTTPGHYPTYTVNIYGKKKYMYIQYILLYGKTFPPCFLLFFFWWRKYKNGDGQITWWLAVTISSSGRISTTYIAANNNSNIMLKREKQRKISNIVRVVFHPPVEVAHCSIFLY